jgi:PiT family inorganic phosphate transporter
MIPLVVLVLAAVAFAFAVSIGAHYTGACMGMPFAAGAIRLGPALWLMAPLALVGAVVASGSVESTVGHGILDATPVAIGVALAIVAAALLLTSAYNLVTIPTSTIQILVFSVVGAGLAAGISIDWSTIEVLLVVWATAPFAAFALGFVLVRALDARRPSVVRRSSSLPHGLALALVAVGAGASFAMGANDVSNASGALVMTGLFGLGLAALIGGVGLAVGVVSWGRPLLRTVAFDIVRLDPAMATMAQFAQAVVILVSVGFGYFTSMNQALVGAMLGAGVARGRSTVSRGAVRGVLVGWAVGPASGAALGFAFAWIAVRGAGF